MTITFQKHSGVKWTDAFTVYAEETQVNEKPAFLIDQRQGITTDMRVKAEGVSYKVTSVKNKNKKIENTV